MIKIKKEVRELPQKKMIKKQQRKEERIKFKKIKNLQQKNFK